MPERVSLETLGSLWRPSGDAPETLVLPFRRCYCGGPPRVNGPKGLGPQRASNSQCLYARPHATFANIESSTKRLVLQFMLNIVRVPEGLRRVPGLYKCMFCYKYYISMTQILE